MKKLIYIIVIILLSGGIQIANKPSTRLDSQKYAMMILLDKSGSMDAVDLEPSRIESCKQALTKLIKDSEDFWFGLAVSMENCVELINVSGDHQMVIAALKSDVQKKYVQYNDIGAALAFAAFKLTKINAEKKAILLLTDIDYIKGHLHPFDAADLANYLGIPVYCIGIGRDNNVPFLLKEESGTRKVMKDLAPINETMLKEVAVRTDGLYFRILENQSFPTIFNKIKTHFYSTPNFVSTAQKPSMDQQAAEFILSKMEQYNSKPQLNQKKEIKVTASIKGDNKIGLEDTLIFSISIQGIENPKSPVFPKLSSFQLRNTGTWGKDFLYFLKPQKIGIFTIPPILYKHQGKNYSTEPIDVEVIPGSKFQEDNWIPSSKDKNDYSFKTQKIAIKAYVNKKKMYSHDHLKLKLSYHGINNPERPELNIKDFKVIPSFRGEAITGGFRNIQSYIFLLKPQKTGTLWIPAFTYTLKGNTYKTEPIQIQVMKGDARLNLKVKTSKQEVTRGDFLNFSIEIETNGRIEIGYLFSDFPPPGFWQEPRPSSFYISTPKSIQKNHLIQVKEVILYPLRTGELTIPALKYELRVKFGPSLGSKVINFDSWAEKITKSTPEIKIKVLPK